MSSFLVSFSIKVQNKMPILPAVHVATLLLKHASCSSVACPEPPCTAPQWPAAFTSLAGTLGNVNLNIFSVVDIECVNKDTTFYTTLVVTLLFPVVVSIVIFAALGVRLLLRPRSKTRQTDSANADEVTQEGQADVDTREVTGMWTTHIKIWVFFVFLIYPSVHH